MSSSMEPVTSLLLDLCNFLNLSANAYESRLESYCTLEFACSILLSIFYSNSIFKHDGSFSIFSHGLWRVGLKSHLYDQLSWAGHYTSGGIEHMGISIVTCGEKKLLLTCAENQMKRFTTGIEIKTLLVGKKFIYLIYIVLAPPFWCKFARAQTTTKRQQKREVYVVFSKLSWDSVRSSQLHVRPVQVEENCDCRIRERGRERGVGFAKKNM